MPPVFVAVVYRPPDIASLMDDSEVILNYRIIMDDLNVNMLSTTEDSNYIRQLACELNLKIVEHDATTTSGTPTSGLT